MGELRGNFESSRAFAALGITYMDFLFPLRNVGFTRFPMLGWHRDAVELHVQLDRPSLKNDGHRRTVVDAVNHQT